MTARTDPDGQINIDTDHNCFGCGRLNQHGLRLSFVPHERGGVRTEFTPAARFEGYDGMVHGGVISTVLDEVMAWSLYRQETWAVTGELTVRYRSPIRVGEATCAIGWMTGRRGRRIEMAGEIVRASDAVVLARATAVFVAVPESQAEAWRQRYLASQGQFSDHNGRDDR
ncbi:MAG: PaaI family thioesterase [Chloroflexota bacterium]|nr:PaaI family thioesterase [Chloroflexota bacterium]